MVPAHARLLDTWFESLDHGTEAESLRLVDQLFAPDYVCHMAAGEMMGRDGLRAHTSGGYAVFADMEHRILENFGDGDLLATRVLFSAVHKGEFFGMPPTGARVECPITYIHRFADGLIQEAWLDWDSLMMLSQQIAAAAAASEPIDA